MDQAPQGESSNMVTTQSPNTPSHESRRERPTITAAQKQAMIDNLQLEITERARKLRAQYALHAQGLRSRLEMRINRIPRALRSVGIIELIDVYSEQLVPSKPQVLPSTRQVMPKASAITKGSAPTAISPARKALKRDSTEMLGISDKENQQTELDLPKKRTKGNALTTGTTSQAGRAPSRKIDPSKILSPKSHNSRTLPQSPFKTLQASPGKSGLAKPVSPIKPGTVAAATASLANLVTATDKPTRSTASTRTTAKTAATGSARGRGTGATKSAMGPPPVPPKGTGRTRAASNSSQTSDSSSQTTIVRKPGMVRKAVNKVTGQGAKSNTKATASKATLKKEIPAPTAAGTGGRVLRARR